MTFILSDRVQETSTTTGTGTLTLAGAVSGYRTFASVCANADTVEYCIFLPADGTWEIGLGTYNTSTLSRDSVYASSNAGAKVNFAAGSKYVWLNIGANQLSLIAAAQNANKVLAGPTTGADAVPTIRALVKADIPAAVIGQSEATCNGRLTLTTVTPFTISDVLAATTLYFTPYAGDQIALFDGSSTWTLITFAEISIAVPATTSQMYDVFVFNNAGVAALELLAWTNDTTRATNLVLQNGVLVKSGDTTRRYVGSMRTTTVSGQTEVSSKRIFVWNYYNRLLRFLKAVESTSSWSYVTASYRAANGATVVGTSRVEVIIGWAEALVKARVEAAVNFPGTGFPGPGVGLDSTTVNSALVTATAFSSNNQAYLSDYAGYLAVGYHFIQWLEIGAASATFYGTGITNAQTGLLAELAA